MYIYMYFCVVLFCFSRKHSPGLGDFVTLGANSGTVMYSTLVLRAILVYATYRTSDTYGRKLQKTKTRPSKPCNNSPRRR